MLTDQTGAVTGDATFYRWGQVWQISGGSDGTFGDLGFEVNYPLPPSERVAQSLGVKRLCGF